MRYRRLVPEAERRVIRSLLDSGKGILSIHRLTGVSIKAIYSIRNGKPVTQPTTPIRCPGCGGMIVVQPCMACSLLSRKG